MCSYIDKLNITTVQRRWTGQVLIVIFSSDCFSGPLG